MATKIEITCFTDLKGSTSLTEVLGHHGAMPILFEHLRVGLALARRNNGKYVKNMGDAHMVRFEYVEDALAFATQLQQLCVDHPGVKATTVPVRVGLFLGPVEPIGEDVFGSGVNQAARVQGTTQPGQVRINDALQVAMRSVFNPSNTARYCDSLGEFELKGISEPPKQTLYEFKWQEYLKDCPAVSVAALLHQHMLAAGVDASNFSERDLGQPGFVIWPVVPRDLATAIHRAQFELMGLMAMAGWQVRVLIADCGDERDYDKEYIDSFQQCLEVHAEARGLVLSEIKRMSELYDPGYDAYRDLQQLFRLITTRMSVADLMAINNKDYAEPVTAEMQQRPTLTYLRPALTVAAVLHLAEREGPNKCAVVSGSDEKIQWKQAYNVPRAMSKIGALMIPRLKMDRLHQVHQRERFPIWDSKTELISHIGEGNTEARPNSGWWLFRLLAFLPAFPDDKVTLNGGAFGASDWSDEAVVPPSLDVNALVNLVWSKLSPA